MNLVSSTCYVDLGNKMMAAILRDDETMKYYYQVVQSSIFGITSEQIKIQDMVGPFDDFKACLDAAQKVAAL